MPSLVHVSIWKQAWPGVGTQHRMQQQDFEVMGFMAPLIVVRRKVRWRLWKLDLPALATILLRLSSGLINHVQPAKGTDMDRRCSLRFTERQMTEKDATKYLVEILKTFTTGSVLQMLADIHRKNAERAMNVGDELRASQYCFS